MPAYNNYYPSTYQSPVMQYQNAIPQYPYASLQAMAPQNCNNAGIIWVQGEIGAKAYPSPAAGCSILLMDAEDQRFYIKSTDTSGMPLPLRTFSYSEEVAAQKSFDGRQVDTAQYITRQEVEDLLNERVPIQVPAKRGAKNESAI